MWRLTMSDGTTLAAPNLDPSRRAAAMAEMGQRLAAAGVRTRRHVTRRHTAQSDAPGDRAAENLPAAATGDVRGDPDANPDADADADAVADDNTAGPDDSTISHYIIYGRRVVLLGAAAMCGFGAVLLAESRWPATLLHGLSRVASGVPAAPVQPQDLAGQHLPPAAPAAAQPAIRSIKESAAPMRVAAAREIPAHRTIGSHATYTAPVVAKPPAETKTLAETALPGTRALLAHPPLRAPVHHASPLMVAHAEAKPHGQHAVSVASIELPRWLTESQVPQPRAVVQPRVLIMSPPPHTLTPPPDPAPAPAAAPAPAPAAIVQPAPRPVRPPPPVIVANSSYPAAAAYGRPPAPPYYGSPYGGPYGTPYGGYYAPPYGGYYGGGYGTGGSY